MSYVDTNLTQYALKPLYYINGYKDGLQFISTLLTSNTNPLLLCFEIEFLTILEKYEHAMKLGKYLTVLLQGNGAEDSSGLSARKQQACPDNAGRQGFPGACR